MYLCWIWVLGITELTTSWQFSFAGPKEFYIMHARISIQTKIEGTPAPSGDFWVLSLMTSVINSSRLDLSKWYSISFWLRETSRLCLNVPQCAAFQIQLWWVVESPSFLSLTGSWVWMDSCPITKTSNLKVSYHGRRVSPMLFITLSEEPE